MSLRHPVHPLTVPVLTTLLLVAAPPASIEAQSTERGEPRIVEMDEQPALRNGEAMARLLETRYPPLLRDAGIEGAPEVWIYVDELGRVRETRLRETSGYVAFDEAAEVIAGLMSFEAARRGGQAIGVWVPMTINFRQSAATSEAATVPEPEMRIESPAPQKPSAEDGPTFTPMTVPPRLQNGGEVSRALQAHYPPELRDAGIGGTTNVWFFIDEEGVVQKTQVNESSGFEPFDQAALEVAGIMRFSSALNREEKVPVWVAMDITFEVQ